MEAVWEEVGKAWEIFLQSASDCLAGMFFSCISYLIRSGKFSIFFSVLFFAFWTWNALLVLLVGNTFKCWETGEVMKFPPLLLKRKIFNLLCTNMKSQARLPGGSTGKDGTAQGLGSLMRYMPLPVPAVGAGWISLLWQAAFWGVFAFMREKIPFVCD